MLIVWTFFQQTSHYFLAPASQKVHGKISTSYISIFSTTLIPQELLFYRLLKRSYIIKIFLYTSKKINWFRKNKINFHRQKICLKWYCFLSKNLRRRFEQTSNKPRRKNIFFHLKKVRDFTDFVRLWNSIQLWFSYGNQRH